MTLSRILRAKMSVGSTRVRVAGGDLCRHRSAEAPTEPAGETGALPRYLRITPHQCRPLKRAPEPRLNFMVAESVVLFLGKLTCRRPSFITIRFGQPKAKPTFRNFEGKTAILCIIGKLT